MQDLDHAINDFNQSSTIPAASLDLLVPDACLLPNITKKEP